MARRAVSQRRAPRALGSARPLRARERVIRDWEQSLFPGLDGFGRSIRELIRLEAARPGGGRSAEVVRL